MVAGALVLVAKLPSVKGERAEVFATVYCRMEETPNPPFCRVDEPQELAVKDRLTEFRGGFDSPRQVAVGVHGCMILPERTVEFSSCPEEFLKGWAFVIVPVVEATACSARLAVIRMAQRKKSITS
jgi:hypothetical protein